MVAVALLAGVLSACPQGPDRQRVLQAASALRGPVNAPPWAIAFSAAGEQVVLDASLDGQRWQRTLPANTSCASLEQAAAVTLLSLERTIVVHAPQARVVRQPVPAPAPPVAPAERWRWLLGVGEGVTLDGVGAPWELALEGALRPPEGRLGLRAAARYHTVDRRQLAGAQASWSRAELSAGPELSLDASPVAVALFAQLSGGPSWLGGRSSAGAADFTVWDLGARLGVAVAPEGQGGFRPWLELGAVAWLHRQVVLFPATGVSVSIPSVALDVVVGASWGP